jgi:hypothetical protein
MWRRWLPVGLAILLGVAGLLTWGRLDSQAVPKMTDLARRVIGDTAMLHVEEAVFGAQNRLDEWRYGLRKGAHGVRRAPEAPAPLPATPRAAPLEQLARTPIVGLAGDPPDATAGVWQDKGYYRLTHVYPETQLPSVADIAVIDPRQARLRLVCGSSEPAAFGDGQIPARERAAALMAFSGGFQYHHDHGGIVIDGKSLQPMRDQAGTLVVYRDGRVRVGRWGKEFTRVTPAMQYVRQCLLLVEHSTFNADEPYKALALGRKFFVYRTAIGVRPDGLLVYAAGDKLSAGGLAQAMISAGATDAICLDMNHGNATCGVFTHAKGTLGIAPLTARFPAPARFLGANYRDFFYLTRK